MRTRYELLEDLASHLVEHAQTLYTTCRRRRDRDPAAHHAGLCTAAIWRIGCPRQRGSSGWPAAGVAMLRCSKPSTRRWTTRRRTALTLMGPSPWPCHPAWLYCAPCPRTLFAMTSAPAVALQCVVSAKTQLI